MKIRLSRFILFTGLLLFLFISFVQIITQNGSSAPFWPSSPTDNPWPHIIWQTWKTTVHDLSEEDAGRVRSWSEHNPKWRYELLSDANAESFVKDHFRTEPLIKDTFLALTDNILRADFLRYLLLLGEGGLYADVDTTCLMPIDNWIPEAYNIPLDSYSVILGVESDRPPVENDWKLYNDYSPYIFRLQNWTLAGRRGHPFFRYVAESVVRNLVALAKQQGKSLGEMLVDYRAVVDTTGPIAFTRAFFEYANMTSKSTKSSKTGWTYENFTLLEEPRLVGDILILPIRAFSHIEADREGNGAHAWNFTNVVHHHSQGSWKGEHPQQGGEKSPEELHTEGLQLPP